MDINPQALQRIHAYLQTTKTEEAPPVVEKTSEHEDLKNHVEEKKKNIKKKKSKLKKVDQERSLDWLTNERHKDSANVRLLVSRFGLEASAVHTRDLNDIAWLFERAREKLKTNDTQKIIEHIYKQARKETHFLGSGQQRPWRSLKAKWILE